MSHKNLDDLRSGGTLASRNRRGRKGRPAGFRALEAEERRENRPGNLRGVRAVRAGILSARRCRKNTSESRLIFMPAGRIWCSRIMKTRLPRARPRTAKNLQNTGCTMHFLNIDNRKMSKSLGNFPYGTRDRRTV